MEDSVVPKSDGWFKKGFDKKRFVHQPTEVREYRQQLAEHVRVLSPLALKLIKDTLKGKPVSKLQLVAARDVLDRCGGTPVNSVIIETVNSPDSEDISKYSNAELTAMIKAHGGDQIIGREPVVIEHDSTSPGPEEAVKESLKQVGITE